MVRIPLPHCRLDYVQATYKGCLPVNVLSKGDSFGEIALLYDQPRTATVIAIHPCELLCLRREIYSKTMKAYHRQLLADKIDFLRQTSLFSKWALSDLSILLYNQHTHQFKKGNRFYTQGDPVDFIYVISEGEVQVPPSSSISR